MMIIEKIKKIFEEIDVILFYKSGEGPVSSFLMEKLNSMIPAFKSPKNDIDINAKWKFREDKHGIIIRIYGVVFKNVNDIFESFLGDPPVSCEKNIFGCPQVGYYGKEHRGYHLQYSQEKKYVEIVCVGRRNQTRNR